MTDIRTKCDGCVFATCGRDGFQHGCTLERHSKLGISDESESEKYFLLERFCNTYRPKEWLENLNFKESLDIKNTVMEEVCPRMGFIVNLDTNQKNSIQKLKSTIESIIPNNPSYIIVITDKVEYNEEIWTLLVEFFGVENKELKYHIIQISEKHNDRKDLMIDESFTHAQNGWIYTTTSGEIVDPDLKKKIHDAINVDMRQLIMVKPYDDFNGFLFPAYLFRFLNGNNPKLFADEIFDTRSFIEKVEAADQRSKGKHVLTWEEFNAS